MIPIDFVPDWAKGIVWYQIFPERFWNGDPGNDPRLEDQAGSWPHVQDPPWQVHPWTADWYELQPYERANGKSLWHNLEQTVLVVINCSEQAQPVVLRAGPADHYLDLLNGGEELLVQGGALAVEISPLWGRILLAG